MYVSRLSYIWIPDPLPISERAAGSVYHLSCLFTDVTCYCHFFPLVYCGRGLGSDCNSSLSSSSLICSLAEAEGEVRNSVN